FPLRVGPHPQRLPALAIGSGRWIVTPFFFVHFSAIIRSSAAMSPFSPIPRRHPIRVVLSSTALQPFLSVRKAAALAIAQLGVAAFFISGIAPAALGQSAVWFVLAATFLAAF